MHHEELGRILADLGSLEDPGRRCVICGFPMTHPGPRGPSRILLLVGVGADELLFADPVHTWCAYRCDELPASPEDACYCGHAAREHYAEGGAHRCLRCACSGWARTDPAVWSR